MTPLNLPAKMDFRVGSTEEKMDMTLDDIIKQTRKTKPQRVPIKARFRNANGPGQWSTGQRPANAPAARAALQRSVAARSSNLRQGKIAEVRAQNVAGTFAATQAAGKRPFDPIVTPRSRTWMKNSDVKRSNFTMQRAGPGPKLNPYRPAAGNMKISVLNNGSKFGGQRFSTVPFHRRNKPNVPARLLLTGQPNIERMDVDFAQPQAQKQKGRTLDSLFAEIKERRNIQPLVGRNTQPMVGRSAQQLVIQPFASVYRDSRRGGRSGLLGRRRQGGE